MPPLVLVAIAWVAGLLAAHHWFVPLGVEPLSLVLLSPIPLAALLLWPRDRRMRLAAVCVLALLLAALRYQGALPDLDDPSQVAHYNDRGWVELEGVVSGYPDVRDTWTNLKIEAESIELEGEQYPVRGAVLIRAPRFPEHSYGDRLRISGLLETPPELEGFSYAEYLSRKGIYSYINYARVVTIESGQGSRFWAALFAIKDRARDVLAQLVPDPEASLLQGILLGIRSGIPDDLYEDYNTTGTSHIKVISGSNTTLIAALFALAFGRLLGPRRAYWLVMAGIVLYVLLVGADAAVVRAGLMGGLFVTAIALGRRATAYVSLFATVLILTLINPMALWDVGFQLSFAATLGLIVFAPAIQRLFERGLVQFASPDRASPILRFLNDALILTLAAQILTIPLVVYHFGRLSLVAPLANLLILPVQPPIMGLGGAAAIAGMVPSLGPVARAIAWVPWLLLAYTNAVVRWIATWPFTSLEIDHASAGWLILIYAAIVLLVWTWSRRRETIEGIWSSLTASRSNVLVLGGGAVVATLACLALVQLPDRKLHVAFLDVGQGDAVLISSPTGQQILVDGGPSPTALTTALGKEMPFWDRSLDMLIMTHPDADHISGLVEVLDRYTVGGWMDNGQSDDDATYAECMARLAEAGVPRHAMRAGDRLDLGGGIVLEVLHPPEDLMAGTESDGNNNSLVLRLTWGEAEFLLTGDIGTEAEHLLLGSTQDLSADLLKIAHHGSGGSSSVEFLSAVAPAYAVIPVGGDNRFGHPNEAVLERLAALSDVTVLRTDTEGTIEFTTDGQQVWVRTER
jgi:competence protein ComEC